jgi:Arc/MetJ-type ribon-helix-helix transcriptional regulator
MGLEYAPIPAQRGIKRAGRSKAEGAVAGRIKLLERYQNAAEALHDALLALGSRIHAEDHGEYARLRNLVAKCQYDLDLARLEFERMPEDLKRSGVTRRRH